MGDFAKSDFGAAVLTTAATVGGFMVGGPAGAALALSTGAQVFTQRQAAGAQEVELELAKREEAAAARDREVQRKRRLNAILGEQAAAAAAGGVAMSGSVANISITDAKRAAEESFIDDTMTRSRIAQLDRRRRTVSRLGTLRNATTILGAGTRMAERGDFDKPKPKAGGGGQSDG